METSELKTPADWIKSSIGEINTTDTQTIRPMDYGEERFEYYSIPHYQLNQMPGVEIGAAVGSAKLLLKDGTILFGKLNPRVE